MGWQLRTLSRGGRAGSIGQRSLRQRCGLWLPSLRLFQRQLQRDDLHAIGAQRQRRLQLCRRQRHRGGAAAAVVYDGQQLAVERVRHLAAASAVMKALLAMLFAMTLAGRAIAGDCRLASSTCVDSTASKRISGIVVTLAQVGGCWEYQDTYTCIKPEAIDYCAALTTAGCGQIGSTCSDTAFNGTCNSYSKTFQCGTDQGEPSNTLRLS
ncbi:MAG: hypothetical protein DVS81_15050 [Candidatus Accumulibacter meliphilus]|uniref:Uncharacterized protein n=1 Tax=Candidatus Accumulibacter meliphilus TaxID=2211374 RepID=A0A369XK87_9PROT|nr:MAG: hypothetical protein DVS81_15050 [Candidatus Accumulibacter meliphilus]